MAKKASYPAEIKVGAAAGTIYRNRHPASKSGVIYTAVAGSWRVQRTDPAKAEAELRLHLSKVAAGEVQAAGMTREDRAELMAIRAIAGSTPPTVAIKEWAYEQRRQAEARSGCVPATVESVIEAFIKEGVDNGGQHERTYRAKLTSLLLPTVPHPDHPEHKSKRVPAPDSFQGRHIHTITREEIAARLVTYKDHVTRNDYRKKAIGLWRWAMAAGHIPKDLALAPANTKRAKEESAPIGVCTPGHYAQLLMYVADYHPEYLAATVLAGLAWMRTEEIHGKRSLPTEREHERQMWSDIHLDPEMSKEQPYVLVSYAKRGTPALRKAPLPASAVEWLRTIPEAQRQGPVCPRFALQRVRAIGINLGLKLPDNCFRHACLSHGVEVHQAKERVALWAGTSVKKLDSNYRRPVSNADAVAWFSLSPSYCRTHYKALVQRSHSEISALGGASKSPSKLAAVAENLKAARAVKAASATASPAG